MMEKSAEESGEAYNLSLLENSLWLTAYLLVAIPNFLGNTIVIWIIYKEKSLHTFTYYLLSCLAMADIATGFAASWEALFFTFLNNISRGPFLCKTLQGGLITKIAFVFSVLILAVVSLERYYSITKPTLQKRILRKDRLKFLIPFLFVIAIMWTLPINYVRYKSMEDRKGCFLKNKDVDAGVQVVIYVAMLTFVIPISIMVFSFVKIRKVLWGNATGDITDLNRLVVLKSRRKIIKILLFVIIVFIICVLPQMVFGARFLYSGKIHLYRFTYWLASVNSGVNWIIYSYQSAEFRKSFQKLICCFENHNDENLPNVNTSMGPQQGCNIEVHGNANQLRVGHNSESGAQNGTTAVSLD